MSSRTVFFWSSWSLCVLALLGSPCLRGDSLLENGALEASREETRGDAPTVDAGGRDAMSLVGEEVADFALPDIAGLTVSLGDFGSKRAIVLFFLGTGCPIANLYLRELGKLAEREASNGLVVLGVQSNAGVTRAESAAYAKEFSIPFPVLHDGEQRLADALRVTRTAEVFLLDARRVVRYHGRVDDRFGYTYKREEPRRRDLGEAVRELLAGQPVSVAETEPLGCLLTRRDRAPVESSITYAKEISRIIQTRCHECHRPGMIGPFSLLSYDDVVENSAMIKEVVTLRRMPPWHADRRHGSFSNNRRMPQAEVDQLVAWIDAGAPRGDEKDLPEPKVYAEGWSIDEPDIVFELPEEVTVPADGVVPYRYFRVPTNFKEDVWIQSAEARPGNRSVVHHIIVFHQMPDRSDDARERGSVCGMAPGDPPMLLPPGVGKRIPAGSELLFQMHYTPTGRVEKDRSMVGLVLYRGDGPPRHSAKTLGIMNTRFEIPAGAPHHEARASHTFGQDVRVLSLMPHMHLRGKDFIYRASYPDGREAILLSVPAYDFNWQNTYRLAEPLLLPKGTRIDCVAHFDNSPANPANPDPAKDVRWGDQTWEEMMIGWVGFYPETAKD